MRLTDGRLIVALVLASLVLASLALASAAEPTAAGPETSGPAVVEALTFSREPGTTYVPLRELGEALQWPIGWDRRRRTGSLNGQKLAKRHTRTLLDGTTLVSLAALKERGFRVTWDAEQRTATVEDGERSFQVLNPPKRVAINRATQRLRSRASMAMQRCRGACRSRATS
jgi:hypothetical protein